MTNPCFEELGVRGVCMRPPLTGPDNTDDRYTPVDAGMIIYCLEVISGKGKRTKGGDISMRVFAYVCALASD